MKYNYIGLDEKIIKMIKGSCIDMTLIAYITGEDANVLSFFLAENIEQHNITTYLRYFEGGYSQKTINLFTTTYIVDFFEREKIKLEKEYMTEKYGEKIRKNLRGRWVLDNKTVEEYIPKDTIKHMAMENTVKYAEKEIEEWMNGYEQKHEISEFIDIRKNR